MRFPRVSLLFLMLVWALVVLYPHPGVLVRSVQNVTQPRPDAEAARDLAAALPDDPSLIEAYVLREHVPYRYDWQSFGVPWYFPTAAEALRAGPGDCESRAMVLASILTAKGIPHELRMSFGHIWVEYPGKVATAIENPALEIAGRRDGRFFLQLPENLDVRREVREQLAIHYDPAPPARVSVLFVGLTVIPFGNVLAGLLAGGGLGAPGMQLERAGTGPAWLARRRRRAAQRGRAEGL
jgi:hypothetical protein